MSLIFPFSFSILPPSLAPRSCSWGTPGGPGGAGEHLGGELPKNGPGARGGPGTTPKNPRVVVGPTTCSPGISFVARTPPKPRPLFSWKPLAPRAPGGAPSDGGGGGGTRVAGGPGAIPPGARGREKGEPAGGKRGPRAPAPGGRGGGGRAQKGGIFRGKSQGAPGIPGGRENGKKEGKGVTRKGPRSPP